MLQAMPPKRLGSASSLRSASKSGLPKAGSVKHKPAVAKLSKARRVSTKPFAAPSASSDGKLDTGLAAHDTPLFFRATLVEDLDVRLVLIDVAKAIDKYFVMQAFLDPKVSEKRKARYYLYKRWGNTGTGGQSSLVGPAEQCQIEKKLHDEFKSRTGAKWGDLLVGEKAKPGKYWRASPMLAVTAAAASGAAWQFKTGSGWEDYPAKASDQLELLWAEHEENKKGGGGNPTAARFLVSGKFTYTIELDEMEQRNTETGKARKIRRYLGAAARAEGDGLPEAAGPPPRRAPVAAAAPAAKEEPMDAAAPLLRGTSVEHEDALGESLAFDDDAPMVRADDAAAATVPADLADTIPMAD